MTTHVDRTVEKLVGWEPTHVLLHNGEYVECIVTKRASSKVNYNIYVHLVQDCKGNEFWVDDKAEFYMIDKYFKGL